FLAALFYFWLCPDAAASRWAYWGVKVFLVAWPLVMGMTLLRGRPAQLRRRGRRRYGRAAGWGLLTGLGMALLILAVMQTPLGDLVRDRAGAMRERARHLGILRYYGFFAVFLALAHSLIEEYYWRGFVYRRARALLSRPVATGLASIAFASHHVIVTGRLLSWPLGVLAGAGIALAGAVWCAQYERHRTLLAPWLSHLLADIAVMAVGGRILFG
ncbi:MAG: CPBP family intramembrane metalloprotease, partial [Lentisphaerae bacterium]|nr:CPBP family intramembrane metalloprotease [Lentisphaerota bacterium]